MRNSHTLTTHSPPASRLIRSVAPVALLAALGAPAWAGELPVLPMIDNGGGGYVYVDYDEGSVDPGLHAVTEFLNNEGTADDFAWTGKQGGKLANCVRASVPGTAAGGFAICDTGHHSGKRIKLELTGPGPLDIRLRTNASGGVTEYYNYFKTWNKSGARVLGLEVELGTGTGDNFVPMDQSDPAHRVLFDENSITRFRLPDGLLGAGGQGEGKPVGVGFFSDEDMIVDTPPNTADRTIIGTGIGSGDGFIDNAFHVANFGTAILDDTMVPTAILWDITGTGIDVPLEDGEEFYDVNIAWYDQSQDKWFYGNLGREKITTGNQADPDTFVDLDTRMAKLAEVLGVDVADLGTTGTDGVEVPANILALMRANDAFYTDRVEDLRNTNFNFILDVGDLPEGEFTLRVRPIYPELVEQTASLYQFRVAGNLDGMANVPYLDIGNADTYREAIDDMLGMSDGDRLNALESTSFSFASAFGGLGMSMGREQLFALGTPRAEQTADGTQLATRGGPQAWAMGEGLSGFVALHGSHGSFDDTANGVGYSTGTTGITVGVEKAVGSNAAIGMTLGGVRGKADADLGRGDIEASGMALALYGRATFGEGGAVQGMLGWQNLSFDTRRNVAGLVARGSTDGRLFTAAVQAEYMFGQGAFHWGPTGSLEHYALSVDGFNESGAGAWNLSVADQDQDVTIASLGLRGEYRMSEASRVFGGLAWTRASGDNSVLPAGFIGLPAASLPVDGIDQDWVDVSLGFTTRIGNNNGRGETLLGGEYRGSFGSDYENHGVNVFVKMTF